MAMEFTYKTRPSAGRSSTEFSPSFGPFKRHEAHRNIARHLIIVDRSLDAGRKRIRGLASDTHLRTHSFVQLETMHRETSFG